MKNIFDKYRQKNPHYYGVTTVESILENIKKHGRISVDLDFPDRRDYYAPGFWMLEHIIYGYIFLSEELLIRYITEKLLPFCDDKEFIVKDPEGYIIRFKVKKILEKHRHND